MIQLVVPDLNTKGRVGRCQAFAEAAVGATVRLPSATAAWYDAEIKHYDRNFPDDVIVPIFWRYPNPNNDFEDDGHVAFHVPGRGLLCSPYKEGDARAWLPSIEELERIYSRDGLYPLTFRGWTESVSDVIMVKEETVKLTPDEIDMAFKLAGVTSFREDLTNPDYAANAGLLIRTLFNASGERPIPIVGSTTIPDPDTDQKTPKWLTRFTEWLKKVFAE